MRLLETLRSLSEYILKGAGPLSKNNVKSLLVYFSLVYFTGAKGLYECAKKTSVWKQLRMKGPKVKISIFYFY